MDTAVNNTTIQDKDMHHQAGLGSHRCKHITSFQNFLFEYYCAQQHYIMTKLLFTCNLLLCALYFVAVMATGKLTKSLARADHMNDLLQLNHHH